MANRTIQAFCPEILEIVGAKLTAFDDATGTPATLYSVASGPLPWEHILTFPEPLAGIFLIQYQDSDGVTKAVGWVRIILESTGNYVAAGELALLTNAIAIEAITAKTNLIGTGSAAVNSSVAESGVIDDPIIIGDDYLATNGRAFVWTVDPLPGVSAANATCFFGGASDTGGSWNIEGTVADITVESVPKWQLSFDMARSISGPLQDAMYDWSVEVRDVAGNEVTRVRNINNDYRVAAVEKQT